MQDPYTCDSNPRTSAASTGTVTSHAAPVQHGSTPSTTCLTVLRVPDLFLTVIALLAPREKITLCSSVRAGDGMGGGGLLELRVRRYAATEAGTEIDDAGVRGLVRSFPLLRRLGLFSNRVTDVGLGHVARLRHLRSIDLCCPALTEDGLTATILAWCGWYDRCGGGGGGDRKRLTGEKGEDGEEKETVAAKDGEAAVESFGPAGKHSHAAMPRQLTCRSAGCCCSKCAAARREASVVESFSPQLAAALIAAHGPPRPIADVGPPLVYLNLFNCGQAVTNASGENLWVTVAVVFSRASARMPGCVWQLT